MTTAADGDGGDVPGPAGRLRALVAECAPRLSALSDEASAERPRPGAWSPRELVGHLIDSASNNHQRFVRARFQDDLRFLPYDQDGWVAAQGYAEAPWDELVALWRGFNLHLARVMEAVPHDVRSRVHRDHNLDVIAFAPVAAGAPVTLEAFMADYVDHLAHHLEPWISGEATAG